MVRSGVLMAAGAALAATLAACAPAPTAPTPVAHGLVVGDVPQQPPPVPPRVGFQPPGALGATRFLAFGDSITWGALSSYDGRFVFDGSGHDYPKRLRALLAQFHAPQTFSVTNSSVPGEWAQQGVTRLRAVLPGQQADALLLLEGFNDLNSGQSVSQTVDALGAMLDVAALYRTPVLVATMFQTWHITDPDGHARPNAHTKIAPFNTALRQAVAGRANVHLVDLEKAFGADRSLVGGDGVHPTPAGHQVIATAFLTAIEIAFPVRGSFQ